MKTVLKIVVIGILALLISGFDTDYLADREKPTYGGLPKDTTMAASRSLSLCMSWAQVGETIIVKVEDVK